MAQSEDIFDKEIEKVVKKPKKKLSEKQLANLAKGREKMALKRAELKAKKEANENKKLVKDSDKCAKEGLKEKKAQHKNKRRTLKEINAEKEKQILLKLEKEANESNKKKNSRVELFTNLKIKCLEKAKSVKEYTEIKECLDNIDEETLHDDEKLKEYAKKVMLPYIKEKKTVHFKLDTVEEEQEEEAQEKQEEQEEQEEAE
tara:strand:+ start:37 stop:642 length:606 start_codon:yes stop_codon:yes gene_type:complete